MTDTVLLTPQSAESIIRVIEATPQVHRRYQFFVWTQNQLQTLLPHDLAICGAYQRSHKEVVYEAFHNVAIPAPVLALLTDGRSELIRRLTNLWVERRGRALSADLALLPGDPELDGRPLLAASGLTHVLVHAVARPQRPSEIESIFIFASPRRRSGVEERLHLELLLPHLHSTYLHVQATERELNGPSMPPPGQRAAAPARGTITEREKQILGWVREGKSNVQIGEVLGISALTVKNHVQKILRKLGASNRAQAVARAMTLNLLGRSEEATMPEGLAAHVDHASERLMP